VWRDIRIVPVERIMHDITGAVTRFLRFVRIVTKMEYQRVHGVLRDSDFLRPLEYHFANQEWIEMEESMYFTPQDKNDNWVQTGTAQAIHIPFR